MQIKWRTKLFNNQTITVKRQHPSTYVDFEWVDGDTQCIEGVACNIQPYKDNQRRFTVPEGFRTEDCLILRAHDFQFRTSSEFTKATADTFDYDGYTYEVHLQKNWKRSELSVSHYAALAVRREPVRAKAGG